MSLLRQIAKDQERSIAYTIRGLLKERLSQQSHTCTSEDSSLDYPRTMSVGKEGINPAEVQTSKAVKAVSAVESVEKKLPPSHKEGGGLEREHERKPGGGTKFVKLLPEELEEFRELIQEWWKVKKSAKSERSWNLNMNNLKRIWAHLNVAHSPSGRETFLEELERAIANRWAGFDYNRFLQFSGAKNTAFNRSAMTGEDQKTLDIRAQRKAEYEARMRQENN